MKNIEDYFKLLRKKSYPIDRGLQMSDHEQMRRYMARAFSFLSVDKNEFEKRFYLTPEQAFPEEINRLQYRGLIDVNDQDIRLTMAGEVWGQNVCVEFCSRQWREDLVTEERLCPDGFVKKSDIGVTLHPSSLRSTGSTPRSLRIRKP